MISWADLLEARKTLFTQRRGTRGPWGDAAHSLGWDLGLSFRGGFKNLDGSSHMQVLSKSLLNGAQNEQLRTVQVAHKQVVSSHR